MKSTRIAGSLLIVGLATATAQTYTFTTLAGLARSNGSADGTGGNARFYWPLSVAVDSSGNVVVADAGNSSIRKITPAGVVTTLAGMPGTSGSADGTGNEARFSALSGYIAVAADHEGNVIVADAGNHTIRKISPTGDVTTLAGLARNQGSADGTGSNARFSWPTGVVVDGSGDIFVADSSNHVIRKVTPAGVVSTLAGLAGNRGSVDGVGSTARFFFPASIAADSSGNLYVASYDDTIRKITPTGVVTTLAGQAGSIGTADGTGSNARFDFSYGFPTDNFALGVGVDKAGNVLAADPVGQTIRKITPGGVVTTFAGLLASYGSSDGTGATVRFLVPAGIAVDSTGNIYVADSGNSTIRKGTPDSILAITATPQSQNVAAGSTVVFTSAASGAPDRTYQWWKDGAALSNATNSTLVINKTTNADAGQYACVITDSTGSLTTTAATLTVRSPADADVGRLVNFAIRSSVGSGAEALIMGVTVGGTTSTTAMPVLLRGVGPSLAQFGVTGFVADPALTLFRGSTAIAANDNWGGDPQIASRAAQVGAFRYTSPASSDAALATALAPSAYSVQIGSNTGVMGIALGEFFDATPAGTYTATSPRLVNLSARKQVGAGADTIIAGFVISGQTAKTVLIRAIGPSLAALGVSGVLADPKLQLFADSTMILENDDWGGDAQFASVGASVGAFALSSATSKDSALLVTLPPGNYTAQVGGSNNGTGIALVEIYEVP